MPYPVTLLSATGDFVARLVVPDLKTYLKMAKWEPVQVFNDETLSLNTMVPIKEVVYRLEGYYTKKLNKLYFYIEED